MLPSSFFISYSASLSQRSDDHWGYLVSWKKKKKTISDFWRKRKPRCEWSLRGSHFCRCSLIRSSRFVEHARVRSGRKRRGKHARLQYVQQKDELETTMSCPSQLFELSVYAHLSPAFPLTSHDNLKVFPESSSPVKSQDGGFCFTNAFTLYRNWCK